jgi:hypothetical protein
VVVEVAMRIRPPLTTKLGYDLMRVYLIYRRDLVEFNEYFKRQYYPGNYMIIEEPRDYGEFLRPVLEFENEHDAVMFLLKWS